MPITLKITTRHNGISGLIHNLEVESNPTASYCSLQVTALEAQTEALPDGLYSSLPSVTGSICQTATHLGSKPKLMSLANLISFKHTTHDIFYTIQ